MQIYHAKPFKTKYTRYPYNNIGFHTLIDELGGYYTTKSRLHRELQNLLPGTTSAKRNDGPEIKKYHQHKRNYVKQLLFDATQDNLSKVMIALHLLCFSSATTLQLSDSPLEAVYIYFDTSTYDEIERDEKVHIVVAYNKTVSCI